MNTAPFEGKTLVLFDIDGTLLDVSWVHIKSYKETFLRIARIKIKKDSDLSREFGKAEPEFMRTILAKYGKPKPSKELILRLIKRYGETFGSNTKYIGKKNILPGVIETLEKLKGQGKVLGAVTGNPEVITAALLSAAGLEHFFEVVASSDEWIGGKMIEKRSETVQLAIQRAEQKTGRNFNSKEILVVGDAPFDFLAAKELGVECVLVATGHHSLSKLKKLKPLLAAKSLKEIRLE